jgi:NADPH2:quinone reductase
VIIKEGELVIEERADPEPQEGQLLVRVVAAGLNGADMVQRLGLYPAPPGWPQDIPGMELAGEVVATGEGTTRFSPGDRVMSIVGGGGQAELAIVPEATAMEVPAEVGWEAAGAFPEVFITAHDALVTQGALQEGERVLVTGAAGGVGLAGVQIGLLRGAEVVASVRKPELREALGALGANAIAPEEAEGCGPYDVVLELVGAPNLASNLRALKSGGRIVVIGVGAGARTDVDLLQIMSKRAVLRGSTLRARPLADKAAASAAVERELVPALSNKLISVFVEATYHLSEASQAYARFSRGGKLGKIVLTTGGTVDLRG